MHRIASLRVLLGVLATVSALTPPAASAADARAGRAYFAARCASCHSVGSSARGGFGPELHNIVGRRAGDTADFRYSPAMKASKLVWTPENLRRFLLSPDKVVPGTSMRFMGVRSERSIEDLLMYLQQLQ